MSVVRDLQRLLHVSKDVDQIHEIRLRDVDAYEPDEKARTVVFIPIGSVIGIAIVTEKQAVADEDIVFVSASAFGNAIPALGFTARGPVTVLVPPVDNRGGTP